MKEDLFSFHKIQFALACFPIAFRKRAFGLSVDHCCGGPEALSTATIAKHASGNAEVETSGNAADQSGRSFLAKYP